MVFRKSREKSKDGDIHIKVLRYITDKLAKWEYLPIDSEGKIQKGTMTWGVVGSEPDFLLSQDELGGREPFFILKNNDAIPVNISTKKDKNGEDSVQTYDPSAVTQLIDNQNLRFMTKIPIEKFSKLKLFLLLFVGIAFGMAIMFAVMNIFGL